MFNAKKKITQIVNQYFAWVGFVSFCDHHFYGPIINHNSVVVDLGANRGIFSSQINSGFGCICYAVEASSYVYAQIQESHLLKKFNYAIAESNAAVTFYISKNPGASSVNRVISDWAGTQGASIVEGITLETFLDKNKIASIDLLKVDIEGAELGLFNSVSDDTMRKIKQITVEFHDFIKEFGRLEEIKGIKKRLRSLGFFCIAFSRPYNNNEDILFINKKQCKISVLGWLHLYIIEYFILRIKYLLIRLIRKSR